MDFVVKVRSKYPYLTPNDASDIVDKAKMFYFALQYPCEPFVTEAERPIESFFAKQEAIVLLPDAAGPSIAITLTPIIKPPLI
jgi:hypothetical protein